MGNNMEYDKSELDSRLFDGFADTSRRRYMFLCNMRTNVSRWSKNAVEHFDLPGEYMLHAGTIWGELIHPDDRDIYSEAVDDVFNGIKTRFDLDYRVKNRDGEYVACTCRGHVVKGENADAQQGEKFAGIAVAVEKAGGHKCERCWMYVDELSSDPNHPTLCKRCAEIVG